MQDLWLGLVLIFSGPGVKLGVSNRSLFTPFPSVPSRELSESSYNVTGKPVAETRRAGNAPSRPSGGPCDERERSNGKFVTVARYEVMSHIEDERARLRPELKGFICSPILEPWSIDLLYV